MPDMACGLFESSLSTSFCRRIADDVFLLHSAGLLRLIVPYLTPALFVANS